jgi:hypothetical protein
MKKPFLVFALFLIISGASGQNKKTIEPPARVKDKVEQLYPQARNVKWSMEEGEYEASFKQEAGETSLVFDSKGDLLETETEIPVYSLPKVSKDYVARNYAGMKITEAAKMTDSSGVVTYEAHVNKMDLIFNADGGFIKIVKKPGRSD